MSFIFGPPVTGNNFINREKELYILSKEIKDRINVQNDKPHIEISAPRRIGKTSLLMQVTNSLEQEGYIPIYIQLMDIDSVDGFFDRVREEVIKKLPISRRTMEKLKDTIQSVRLDITKLKPSVDLDGTYSVDLEEVLSLYKGTWKDKGNGLFELLRKYKQLKFVLFLDEMGFVRKLKVDDKEKLAFLNFLDTQLSEKDTPTCVLCGSQNFFLILRGINPEVFDSWRRKFMRLPIETFDQNTTIHKLILPNLNESEVFKDDFFTDDIKKGIGELIYFISRGYPSVAQILGKKLEDELGYLQFTGEKIEFDILKDRFFHVFKENIMKDKQGISNELLSEEALGENHKEYRKLLSELYFNESLDVHLLETDLKGFELDKVLKDLEEQQYVELSGNRYTISYPFLKYYIWHPRKDEKIIEEVNAKWTNIFQT